MKKLLQNASFALFMILILISCNNNPPVRHQSIEYATSGPDTGFLVIVGGNMKDTSIIRKFISLAGGYDSPFVVIPTASGEKVIDSKIAAEILTSAGAKNVTVLHTYEPSVANSEEFVKPLKNARGVWFNGGRQWRIVEAYANTLTEKEIRNVLSRGGVIGGSSAGATIQGSYLVRGDTRTNTLLMGDHDKGFGYLRNSAIDQHLLVRNRQNDLPSLISKYPELLGIGLDENTAIVVNKNAFEVIGQSFVAIYDYRLWQENPEGSKKLKNGAKFFLLRRGDRYNMKERKVTRWAGDATRNIFADSIADKQIN